MRRAGLDRGAGLGIAVAAEIGIPAGPDGVTPGWLGAALRVGVRSLTLARIGEAEGFTGGRLYRLVPEYDAPGAGQPASLVVKLSPEDAGLRALLAAANRREVEIYGRFGDNGLPAPRCHLGVAASAGGASVLLMADKGGYRSVPFVDGCALAEAEAVVDALAALHARWWESARLAEVGAAGAGREFGFAQLWREYPGRVAKLLGAEVLPAGFLALGDFLAANEAAVVAGLAAGPQALVHGDAQIDNFLFGGADGVVMIDWQFAGCGRGASDLGYFLVSSLPPDLRRRKERGLVARYHAGLVRLGVRGYGPEALWDDYLRAVATKLHLTVAATVLLDNSGAAKAAWRRADLERLIAFCADHAIGAEAFR